MELPPDIRLQQGLIQWSRYLMVIVIITAILVLLGWQFDIDLFKRPLAGLAAMNPVTALSLLLSAVSLLLLSPHSSLQRPVTGYILAGIVVIIGLSRLLEILFDLQLKIDQVLFTEKLLADKVTILTRMAPNTAFCLVVTGMGLLLLHKTLRSNRCPSQYMALLVGFVSLLSIIGYLYQVKAFYGVLAYKPMSVHTAWCFLFIALALLFVNPGKGMMQEFTSQFSGSIAARLNIPVAILIPVCLGLLRLYAHWFHLYSAELGTVLFILCIIVVFLGVAWYNTILLNKRDGLKKAAEDTLRRSEQQISLFVNNIKDYAIFMIDPAGIIVSWNEGAAHIKGYSAGEMIGKHISVFYTKGELMTGEPQRSLQVAKENGRFETEGWRIRKNGDLFWANIIFTAVYDATGQLQGYTKITRDITERKKTQEQIAYMARLVEDTSDAVFSIDGNFILKTWNKAAEALYGYTREEAVGRVAGDMLRAQMDEDTRTGLRKKIVEQGYWKGEVVHLRKDGQPVTVLISVSVTRNAKGEVDGYVSVCSDITERKMLEEKVMHLARLIEDTSDAVFSTDSSYVLKTWNKAAEVLFGFTRQEAIGHVTNDILKTQMDEAERTELRKKVADQGYWKGELVYLKKNGLPVTVLMSVSVTRTAKDEVDGFVSVCRDITERKELERKLKKFNEELEAQVTLKTAELTNVFERITDGFIALDKNYCYTYINEKGGELSRHKPQELIGRYIWDVFPDAIDSDIYKSFAKALTEQCYVNLVNHYEPYDLWLEYYIYPSPEGLSIFLRNITERKRSELALQYSEETRRLIMNSALDAIISIDKKGIITSWNPQAEKIFGWKREEVTGTELSDTIIPARYRDAHQKGMSHYLATGHGPVLNKMIELEALNKQGKEFPIEMAIVAIEQESEEFFCAFIRDITERKKTEEEINAAASKYKLLFENNPMPMWMRSVESQQVIEVNMAACKAFGYTREEFMELSPVEFRHPDEVEKFLKEFKDDFSVASDRGIWKHRKKNGEYLSVEIIAQDIVYNRQKVRLILANDVTEKITAGEKLNHSYQEIRQLASRLQQIREEERAAMAREVHDELGQQVTGLKMDVSWISKRITTENEPVKQKVKGILELLDNTVKTVRKIATDLRPSILDDLGLAEAMQWHSQEFEKRSGIPTRFDSNISQLTIPGNISIALFRIYQESLTNVARHANATVVESNLQLRNDELVLKITDNGKGFDMSKTGQKKTLGLLGMKERTQMMGGRYEIISQPGKGTTVLVSVPWIATPNCEQ